MHLLCDPVMQGSVVPRACTCTGAPRGRGDALPLLVTGAHVVAVLLASAILIVHLLLLHLVAHL